MADLRRVGCIENGTFVDAGGLLQVQLSGVSPGLASVEQLFSQGFSNAETCSIVFYTDRTTWAAYSGAVFTTGTPNYLDLLTATEEETGSSGAPADGTSVVVYAITEYSAATSVDITNIDLDGGTDIGAALADADLILVDDGASGTNRKSAMSRVWTYVNGKGPEIIQVACSDTTSDLATGTAVATFRMPFAMTLTGVRCSVSTAPTDATLQVDINESGTSILSTVLSIDATEKTSTTAATAPVISDSSLADDAEMTIDIDQVGSTVAGVGLVVTLIGTRT